MRSTTTIVLLLTVLPRMAEATVKPSVRQLLGESEWVVAARIVSVQNTSTPIRFRLVLEIDHLLKGEGLPRSEDHPQQVSVYYSFYGEVDGPFHEGPDFRDAYWRSDEFLFFLLQAPKTGQLVLTDEWFGAEPITPDVLDQLSKAGIDTRPLAAARDAPLYFGGAMLIVLAAAAVVVATSIACQSRLVRDSARRLHPRHKDRCERNADPLTFFASLFPRR